MEAFKQLRHPNAVLTVILEEQKGRNNAAVGSLLSRRADDAWLGWGRGEAGLHRFPWEPRPEQHPSGRVTDLGKSTVSVGSEWDGWGLGGKDLSSGD